MAFKLSFGMGGIFTGRERCGRIFCAWNSWGRRAAGNTSPLPASLPTLGGRKEPGAQGREVVSQVVLPPFTFQRPDFFSS